MSCHLCEDIAQCACYEQDYRETWGRLAYVLRYVFGLLRYRVCDSAEYESRFLLVLLFHMLYGLE